MLLPITLQNVDHFSKLAKLFQIYSQTEQKEDWRNLTTNGKNYRNKRRRCYCYYGNGVRWRRNKLMHGRRKVNLPLMGLKSRKYIELRV